MGLADLPSELLRDVLFRAARGTTADRVAELLSVCKIFCREIKKCSINHATQARPAANQPLKLQDCAALKSLVVAKRRTSLLTQHIAQSGTAVAVQALTSLTVMIPPTELWYVYWLEIESIIKMAPALGVVVLKNAPVTLLPCLGSLHALISLRFTSEGTCLFGAEGDPFELMHCIMHLTTLQDLHVHCLSLRRLPGSISQLTALQVLSLNDCGLVELPDSIGQLTALQVLSLTGCCDLVGLPDSIGKLTALTMLDLGCVDKSHCYIKHYPDSLMNNYADPLLPMDGLIGLMALPDSIGHLTALKSLSLLLCALTRLPESMGQLTALQDLNLTLCTHLVELPDSMGQLTALQRLDLTGCTGFVRFPDIIGQLTALQSLNLSQSDFIEVPDIIGQLTALRVLDLTYSSILSELPDSIGHLAALQRLILSECRGLARLPDSIGHLNALQELNLSGCFRLKSLPDSIGQLTTLKTLYLSGCDGLRLPENIRRLAGRFS